MGTDFTETLNTDADGRYTSSEYGDIGTGVDAWFFRAVTADGGNDALGATTDAEASGNGSLIAIMKRIRGFFRAEDSGHTTGDYGLPVFGVRNDSLAVTAGSDLDYALESRGSVGETFNTLIPAQLAATAAAAALSEAATTALATNLVIKASAGTLYRLSGINNNAAVRYLQIHNTISLPADGVVPALVFQLPLTSGFSFDLGVYGRRFSTGITACLSTTLATKTIAAADLWLNAGYK